MMSSLHTVWHLMAKANLSKTEDMLLKSILILSVSTFRNKTFEQIYDQLASLEPFNEASGSLKEQLNRIEETVMSTNAGVQRLQADEAALTKTLADLQAALATLLSAQSDAEGRLEADIAALRSQGGSGDPAAINAIADSLESTQAAFSAVTSQLTQAAQAQVAVDAVPPPVLPVPTTTPTPAPSTTLTITPSTVATVRDATVQFTASVAGATFKAVAGTIDATGLYTPPTDVSVASDTVTASLPDGSQSATATVTIS